MPISMPDENPAVRPRLGLILATTIIGALYVLYAASAISLLVAMRQAPEVLTAAHELPQSDFGLFWCAGHGLLAQAAARFGLASGAPAYLHICQVNILADSAPIKLAWPYPPPMGFLVVPFALIPLTPSFWVWRAASILLAALLLRSTGLGRGVIVAGLGSTAALHDLVGGQNGTLFAGVLVCALLLAESRPGWAGWLAGMLVMKPQLALVFPALALRPGRLKLAASGLITALSLAALSWAVWGQAAWRFFLAVAQPDEMKQAAVPFATFFPAAGITVFSMARSLGGGVQAAWAWQVAASVTALALIWAAWRPGTMAPVPRMALTCALGILAMPHGFAYDLVAFSIGVAALYARAGLLARLVLGMLWLLGGYTITLANLTGLVLFPIFAAIGAAMAWRLRAAAGGDINPAPP
jgi:hypothetical protein